MTDSPPYLTLAETAALVRVSVKRLRNLMVDGTLVAGVHLTRPRGLRPRFKWDALVARLERRDWETTGGATPHSRRERPPCKLDKSLL